jgi:hypothetical protein
MEAPYNIVNYRREQCVACPTPCEVQNNLDYRKNGDNACPQGRWMAYKTYVKNPKPVRGLGDLVAKVAEPIAGAIDKASGGRTKLKGCSACAKRKEMLNQLLPFGG